VDQELVQALAAKLFCKVGMEEMEVVVQPEEALLLLVALEETFLVQEELLIFPAAYQQTEMVAQFMLQDLMLSVQTVVVALLTLRLVRQQELVLPELYQLQEAILVLELQAMVHQ
jgi:hypothetical protein